MADLMASFREQAQALWRKIREEGGLQETVAGLRQRMAEADQRRAIHKARSQLRELRGQIDELITAVGVQTVGLYRSGRLKAPELEPLCQHVAELQRTLEEQETELVRLEDELEAAQDAAAREEAAQKAGAQETAPQEASAPSPDATSKQAPRCPACGKALPEGDLAYCPHCAQPLPQKPVPTPRNCETCGAELRPGAGFCSVCGAPV